jgi:hypothetical protein
VHRKTKPFAAALVLAMAALTVQRTLLAQEATPAARAAARDLGYEGVKAFQNGDYKAACDRLSRAYQVLKAPSLGLWFGRCLVQKNMLVEASETFLEVTRLTPSSGELEIQRQAQKDAAKEREGVLPRIAKLTIVVTPGASATVMLDNVDVSPALLGVASPVNPGTHVIVARNAQGVTVTRDIILVEGAAETVTLELKGAAPAAPAVAPAAGGPSSTSTQPSGASVPKPSSPSAEARSIAPPSAATQQPAVPRWVGYTALAVGGLGVTAGTIWGVQTRSKLHSSPLSEGCFGNRCSPAVASEVDDYNRSRTLSMVGFGVGALGLISGAVVLWVLPNSKHQESAPTVSLVTTSRVQAISLRLPF